MAGAGAVRLEPPSLDAVVEARRRISGIALRTPLVGLSGVSVASSIFLKLENLQPIGSFKLRGAANVMGLATPATLADGVYTASAGNMAQGVAWCARERGISCRVVVPETAPANKLAAIARLGATAVAVPFEAWWGAMVNHGYPGIPGLFVHPFADVNVLAGNGTIALELMEDAPALDAVIVPWGGGGLACGIAAVLRVTAPHVRVYAVELDVAAPLTASFERGEATEITPIRTFVDGIGGRGVAPEMFALAQRLLAGVLRVSIGEVRYAVKLMADQCRVVAEGAGAAPVAAALAGLAGPGRVACIVSGGNIDSSILAGILRGDSQ